MSTLSRRNHVLYQLTNTVTGEIYIGLTVATGRAYKYSVKTRFSKHCSRALNETHEWAICRSIREHTPAVFTFRVLEVVKGRILAHKRERELIHELNPALNTQ